MTQQERNDENRRKEREKQSAIFAKEEAERKERQRREQALVPTFDERMAARLRGVTKFAARFKRLEEFEKAKKLEAFAATMTDALTEYRRLTGIMSSAKRPTPLEAATTKAGKALLKALPSCFENEGEAVNWAARFLPLTTARIEQGRSDDGFIKTSRLRSLEQRKFEAAFSEAARLATGNGNDTALRELEMLGMEM